jgi:hypothetical protein
MNKIFSYDYGDGVSGKCLWFRFFGYGFHFKNHDGTLMFSERYGYTPFLVVFGVTIKLLKPR